MSPVASIELHFFHFSEVVTMGKKTKNTKKTFSFSFIALKNHSGEK